MQKITHNENIDKEIISKAQKIKLFAMDVDGVLSDGKIIYNSYEVETKAFFVQDGFGLVSLKKYGISLAIITGRNSPMVDRRAKELGVDYVIQGRDDKYTQLNILAERLGLDMTQCAYIGDDLPDLKALIHAGFGVAPANAVNEVKNAADFVTQKTGGNGAVREVCDFILKAQGHYDDFIAHFK